MSKTLLIKNARVLVTMDAQRREIEDGAVFIRDNVIERVGTTDDLPEAADEVIDAAGHVVIPGLVNTHHHMYQSLTRVIPAAQDGELFNWLTNLYPVWANLTGEMVHVSTLTAMAELILSGCTTSSDHLYIYPNDCRLDDSIEAAHTIGMRFHASRGAMSVGRSKGGLPPDSVVEDEAAILKDTQRMSCSLTGHAVVRAEAGDRGCRLAGCQVFRGDALTQHRGDAHVCSRIRPGTSHGGCCG